MELQDKVALITGGSRGIGAAAAEALAQRGARLALVGRYDDDETRQTCQRITACGAQCLFIPADVGKPAEATRCVEEAAAKFGSVDVLVHSAGGPHPGTILEVTPEEWMYAFDVHVHAIYHLCRAAIPLMQKCGEGSIMLVSSAAGIRGCPKTTCYQVVKGALPQFARALARDFADDNIRVNCVAPGIIRTRFHANMTEQAKANNLKNRVPLHREGTSEQVASLIVELLANDYITGETVSIDGGLTMRVV